MYQMAGRFFILYHNDGNTSFSHYRYYVKKKKKCIYNASSPKKTFYCIDINVLLPYTGELKNILVESILLELFSY